MTFPLTLAANLTRKKNNLRPQIVFSIDGIDTKFGASEILEIVRIGAPGLLIGPSWTIGGTTAIADQADYISFTAGQTTTKITQQLQPDKGLGTSVTQFAITLIDKNETISEIISPGFTVSEILGRQARIQIGFQENAYPDDYITILRGILEDITSGPGYVTFTVSSTEQKKRQTLFQRGTAALDVSMDGVSNYISIGVDSTADFLAPITGPSGGIDSQLTCYFRVDDEIFKYTGISGGTTFTGVVRAQLGTTAAAHDSAATVSSVYRIQGNGLDIARKLMLSGVGGYFKTGVDVTNFVNISVSETVANSIYFEGVDIQDTAGVYVGDYITTTGASNGANNVSLKQVTAVAKTVGGSYIEVSGVTFVSEMDSAATISFRSKWDVWPDGCGMSSDDVDLAEFQSLYTLFLSSFDFDFYLQDSIEAKTFIEEQLLRPMSAFSIPRKGRVSVGYHIGPIPGAELLTLDQTNIENADKLKIRRSLSKNYYNSVEFSFDKDLFSGDYQTVKTTEDSTSIADFNVGARAITVRSDGMRSTLQGDTKAVQSAARFLNRYKRAAEYIDSVEVRFGDSFNAEIGDIVFVDTDSLSITDISQGSRSGTLRIFQILNKTLDIKTGKVTLNLVDTNFSTSARYGLISPASKIKSATSGTVFVIKSSFSSVYGANEGLKWSRFGQIMVRVRSPDGTTRNATSRIDSVSGNTVTLQTSLGFTPQADDLMELSHYDDASAQVKLTYAFMRTTGPFGDGKDLYEML